MSYKKEGYIVFRLDKLFLPGLLYFLAVFLLNTVLPKWAGDENGIIENLQMLWLFAGFAYCFFLSREERLPPWGGKQKALWYAGMIIFFLIIMREINWGRTLILHPDGSQFQYEEMGLYGKMVHPMVGILIAASLYLFYRAKVWLFLRLVKLPLLQTCQLLLFVILQWFAEHKTVSFFAGDLAEELTEFGAYMMLFVILCDVVKELRNK